MCWNSKVININSNLFAYAANNPIKYTDPDGRNPDPYTQIFGNINPFEALGDFLITQGNAAQQKLGLLFSWTAKSELGIDYNIKLTEEINKQMSETADKILYTGAKFISEYGCIASVIAYSTGHVGIGVAIDGVIFVIDGTLIVNEYLKTGDWGKLTSDLSTLFISAIGTSFIEDKYLQIFAKLETKNFLEKAVPVVSNIIDKFISETGEIISNE